MGDLIRKQMVRNCRGFICGIIRDIAAGVPLTITCYLPKAGAGALSSVSSGDNGVMIRRVVMPHVPCVDESVRSVKHIFPFGICVSDSLFSVASKPTAPLVARRELTPGSFTAILFPGTNLSPDKGCSKAPPLGGALL